MATSKHSMEKSRQDPLFSLAVFLVNHSVRPGSAEARKMTAISGRKCFESYGNRIRVGSSVKMLADLLLGTEVWSSTASLLTWKPRVTKSGRLLFQLLPSTPRTGETGSGLLPTPQTVDRGKSRPLRIKKDMKRNPLKLGSWRGDLKDHIAMLPTPTARDSRGTGKEGHPSRDTVDYLIEKGTRKGQMVGKPTGLRLQPSFALWMMGYPTDWLDLEVGEMPLSKARATHGFHKSQSKSLKQLKP